MAHPQPKRRVQLSNDAKHLHAFHFEGHESYHLEGDASFDTDKMKAKRELVKTSPKLRAAAMRPRGHGGEQERAGALAAHAAAEAVHTVRRARATDQDDHAATAGVGPPAAAAAP